MSWRDKLTPEQEEHMANVQANINHVRRCSSSTKHFTHNGEEVVEVERPDAIAHCSMFPYRSTQMAVDPEQVPAVAERLRKQGLFTEFDKEGRPIITSAKQQDALAKALGMKTGRDGFGYTDEHGNFHNTGRRRADEIKEGRSKVRKAIDELRGMPEEGVLVGAVEEVLKPLGVDHPDVMGGTWDIEPTEENTG